MKVDDEIIAWAKPHGYGEMLTGKRVICGGLYMPAWDPFGDIGYEFVIVIIVIT